MANLYQLSSRHLAHLRKQPARCLVHNQIGQHFGYAQGLQKLTQPLMSCHFGLRQWFRGPKDMYSSAQVTRSAENYQV